MVWRKKYNKLHLFFSKIQIYAIYSLNHWLHFIADLYIYRAAWCILIHLKNDNNSTYVHNKNSNNNNNIGAFFWRRGEKRATVIASVLELGRYSSYYLLCIVLDILFSSNHNIHKSSCGLCFLASDPLIERF